jgi:hypothetical protein
MLDITGHGLDLSGAHGGRGEQIQALWIRHRADMIESSLGRLRVLQRQNTGHRILSTKVSITTARLY